MIETALKPNFGDKTYWRISSNVLCNYMREDWHLHMILKNQAIIPRYVIERIEYMKIDDLKQICIPMTCFCDIPFSKVGTHMTSYGSYGIGFDKEAMMNKYRVQPIHYMNDNSPLMDDFRETFRLIYNSKNQFERNPEYNPLVNYLLSTIVYMKPIKGMKKNNAGDMEEYIYQDECEWRFIPSDNFPKELGPIIPPQSQTSERARDMFSDVIAKHKECWMKFEWKDVRYLIVPDEVAVRDTIKVIDNLPLEESEKRILITKIEISRHFMHDL